MIEYSHLQFTVLPANRLACRNTTAKRHTRPVAQTLLTLMLITAVSGCSNNSDKAALTDSSGSARMDSLLDEPTTIDTQRMLPAQILAGSEKLDQQIVTARPNNQIPAEPGNQLGNENLTTLVSKADAGDIDAQYRLGTRLARGISAVLEPEQGRNWLKAAAAAGDNRAMYELGELYYNGRGVQQEYATARDYWIEAAIEGNDNAQLKLGYMYSEGLGVERDFETAKQWYLKSASLGNAEAQTLLGSLYHEGSRIEANYDAAFKWYRLAALQGHAHAQYTLGTLYHDGRGTEVSYVDCMAWVGTAIANGYDDHLGARGECSQYLNSEEKQQATALTEAYRRTYRRAPNPSL